MKRREFLCGICGGAAWPLVARAQQTMPVVGFLNGASPGGYVPYVAAFHRGLRENGFIEGQNVAIEYRWAEGRSAGGPLCNPHYLRKSGFHGGRWPDELWRKSCRRVSPSRSLCRSDSQGHQAGGPAGPAADENRTGYQSKDRKNARPHNPSLVARSRGRVDRVIRFLVACWPIAAPDVCDGMSAVGPGAHGAPGAPQPHARAPSQGRSG